MKRFILVSTILFSVVFAGNAQKYAVVDMDYILKSVPAYESANDQLNQLSNRWQKEVEALLTEVQTMYKNYQTELVFLSAEMKTKREEEIIAKEREANELKRKYFGQDGELFKRREALIKPVQEEIYNAIQELANSRKDKFDLVLDKNSNSGIIFAAPKIDISDDVLQQMGYGAK
ncbi:MAG: OmpH family outer membrane protein [Prevotellaceae bacterium]|jgi:outer membrane protein|nr:OmpH family outer membrane protein [Prevotellaceae bacterium]